MNKQNVANCLTNPFIVLVAFVIVGCGTMATRVTSRADRDSDNPVDSIVREIVASKEKIKTKSIAVIEFTDVNGDLTPEGRLLTERLTTQLATTKEFSVIERSRLKEVIKELKLSLSGVIDPQTVKQVGKILGADAVLTGTLTIIGNKIEINARLVDVETGEIITGVTVQSEREAKIWLKSNEYKIVSVDIGIYYDQNGQLQHIPEGDVLHSGDSYALYIKPSDDCYVYIYQVDDLGHSYRLFPNKEYNTGSNPLLAGQDYWIPNTDQFLVLDETTGKEKFYIFVSPEMLNDLEGNLSLEEKDFGRVLKTMGIAGLKNKTNPTKVTPPQRTQQIAEVKKKLQAEGAFVYETYFWHK